MNCESLLLLFAADCPNSRRYFSHSQRSMKHSIVLLLNWGFSSGMREKLACVVRS